MKIFLTGATGYIGSVIAEKLQAAGHDVIGLARNETTAQKLAKRNVQPFLGNLKDPEQLADGARQADGVIHTAFIHDFDDWAGAVDADCQVIAAFVEALAGTGKPLLATSDTSVLGDTGSKIVDESYPTATGFILAERSRAEASVVQASQRDIRSIVLRLPLYIYGRGGGTSYVPMRLQAAQETGVAHYILPGQHQVSAVHVDDVAELYVLALEKAPAGSIFHAATESGIAEKAIAETIASVVGCQIEGISLEQGITKWGQGIATFFSINNQVSAEKAVKHLGWQPKASISLLEDVRLPLGV